MSSNSISDKKTFDGVDEHARQVDDVHPIPPQLAGYSEEELAQLHRKATRRIDAFVMPAITVLYILNYLDRQNISAAKLASIEKDLALTPVQYQMCISFLFVGYILFQIPSNMVMGKISRPGIYICAATAVWGAISAATGAVHNFAGLITCRAMLGVVEAVFFPGALFYLSTFYTRTQIASRVAFLYSGSQLGNAFGTLFALAILNLEGAHGIEGWRWLFIIEGVATVGIAIGFAFILPSGPGKVPTMSSDMREVALWRLRQENGASDKRNEISALQAFKLAVTDPKTWMLMGVLSCTYISAAVVSFFPSVVKTLGYSRNLTYVLTAPPYLLTCVCMMINGWHSDKTQERFWHIAIPLAIGSIANIIAVSTLHTGARYFAMMLMPTSLYSSAIVTLSWITGSLTQPAVKRAVAIAIINAFANTPNVWTPYLYKAPPRYLNAFVVNLAAAGAGVVLAFVTRTYLARKNRELDRGDRSALGAPTEEQVAAGWRYFH